MTAQTAGDVGGLADRDITSRVENLTLLSNAELCERLRGPVYEPTTCKPSPLQVEAAKRLEAQIDETLNAWSERRRPDIVGFDGADFTWKDDRGVTWYHPTAQAYAQARRKRVAG